MGSALPSSVSDGKPKSEDLTATDLIVTAALMLLVFFLYRKITRLWWTWDDTYLLRLALQHNASEHFVSTELWRSMPQQLFTPLLTASYDLQLALFGAEPQRFYVVHLSQLALTAIALYWTLRYWMPQPPAACASVLFISGAPLCTMATQLMLMHYVLSVLLAVISVAIFAAGLRRARPALSIVSALIYLLALLAKEVAAPLPALLVMLPEGDVRTRLRRLWPHAVALLVYFVWRSTILGQIIGGYAVFSLTELPLRAIRTPYDVFRTFAGPQLLLGIPLLLLLVAGIAVAFRGRRRAGVLLIAFVLALAPIIPAARWYEKRFSYVSWIWVAVAFTAGAASLRKRHLATTLMVATPLLSLAVNRQAWAAEFRAAMRMSDEGRVYSALGCGDFLRNASIPPPSVSELEWFKQNVLHGAAGSRWFFDDVYLCEAAERPRRVFSYDEPTRTVREITADIETIARNHCASIRHDEPLTVRLRYEANVLWWDLGPYDEGKYRAVLGGGIQAFDVARSDALRLTGLPSLTLRIRYQSPQGWMTYSPDLTIDLREGREVSWKRGAQAQGQRSKTSSR